jgi:hypothetical protein
MARDLPDTLPNGGRAGEARFRGPNPRDSAARSHQISAQIRMDARKYAQMEPDHSQLATCLNYFRDLPKSSSRKSC